MAYVDLLAFFTGLSSYREYTILGLLSDGKTAVNIGFLYPKKIIEHIILHRTYLKI